MIPLLVEWRGEEWRLLAINGDVVSIERWDRDVTREYWPPGGDVVRNPVTGLPVNKSVRERRKRHQVKVDTHGEAMPIVDRERGVVGIPFYAEEIEALWEMVG